MSWVGKLKWGLKLRKFINKIREENKMGTKWYLSKTNYAAFITLLASGVALFAPETAAANWISANSDKLLGFIGTALILFRNIWTNQPTEI